jgi:hypothetical protein
MLQQNINIEDFVEDIEYLKEEIEDIEDFTWTNRKRLKTI